MTADVVGAVGLAVTLVTILVGIGIKWGSARRSSKAHDDSLHSHAVEIKTLAELVGSRVVPTLEVLERGNTEQLRQMGAMFRKFDHIEGEIARIDKEQYATAQVVKFFKSTQRFKLTPAEDKAP